MEIQPVSFGARIKMNDIKDITKNIAVASEKAQLNAGFATSGSSGLGSSTVGTLGTTATNSIASGSDILGTAFSAHASGIDSFGIAPSVVEAITPHVTPATIASSNNHPSTIGSLFSTIGGYLSSLTKVNIKAKDPS